MHNDLQQMDLVAIRNLFLEEMQAFLIALDIESAEQLKIRKQRIRDIDAILEEKKRSVRFHEPNRLLDDERRFMTGMNAPEMNE